jgi:hypothetical protein
MRIRQIVSVEALLVTVLLFIGLPNEAALGQSLAWAKRAGGTNFDQGEGIGVDSAGNSYVTGWFTGNATFAPGEANETTLTSSATDIFVAKYNSSGALLWVRQAASDRDTRVEAISVDGAGNSYVTGVFRFGITFHDGTVLPGFANGNSDLFVAKYDGSGNLVWARHAGEDFIPGVADFGKHGRGISADSAGNSYVTGHFITELGEGAFFVAKYATNGTLLWVKRAGNDGVNPSFVSGSFISVDGAGNSYATGDFYGSITFGPGEANQTVLTSGTGFDQRSNLFVAKYDTNGTLLWVRRAGLQGFVQGAGISVDSIGNSHVTGWFQGNATFGPGEPNETPLTDQGSASIFVAKYDSSGGLLWAKQASGGEGLAISVDSAGNSHVTGYFEPSSTFGSGEPNETTLTGLGSRDIFVAKYGSNGALLWARQAGGTGGESGRGIVVDSVGNSYVTGGFAGSATFGQGEANETTLASAADSLDIFVGKYKNDSATPENRAPLADAGTNQTVNVGATVQLDGSGSSDPDGDALTFSWSFVSRPAGSAAALRDPAAARPTFVADLPGTYMMQLIVNDGQVNSTPDTVTVSTNNSSPVANAGADQTVAVRATVRLDGSGSRDPNGDPLTFQWVLTSVPQGSNAVLSDATAVNPTFVADLPGVYLVQLIVNDGSLNSPPDSVMITASETGLQCGSLISGSISARGEVDRHTFSGQANGRVTLTLSAGLGFTVTATLFSPTGRQLLSFSSRSQQQVTLPESGTYVIQVRAFNNISTGAYGLGLECLLPPSPVDEALVCGSLARKSITALGQVDQYTFSGQANGRVTLTLATGLGFTVTATLFSPTGRQLRAFNSRSQQQVTLPESGTYLIQVRTANFIATGGYSLGLECLLPPSPVDATLVCGSLISGAISAQGEVDQYAFSGQANGRVTLTLSLRSAFTVTATLFSPTGQQLLSFRSRERRQVTLPESGTYVIQVRTPNLISTGGYTLGLECP